MFSGEFSLQIQERGNERHREQLCNISPKLVSLNNEIGSCFNIFSTLMIGRCYLVHFIELV